MHFFDDPDLLLKSTGLVERFLRYVKIDTTSDAKSRVCPSTTRQFDLAHLLVAELKELGLADASVDENCYVTATLEGAGESSIGLLAHLDTSSAASGANVKPIIHENYNGTLLLLKDDVVIDPDKCNELKHCLGDSIITSDGTTLLGADDKAGIAIIMSALEKCVTDATINHPTIKVGFTPDEEIGRGHERFPVEQFGADFAVTLDGGFVGELNLETFEAYAVEVTFEGISTHPGTAKGKMVNALRHMAHFMNELPMQPRPETTESREGFIHPTEVEGDAAICKCRLIVRDFDEDGVLEYVKKVERLAKKQVTVEPRLKVNAKVVFSYPNMYKFLKQHPLIAENIVTAIKGAGIEPTIVPIRGGTDGSNLSRKGLLTPNLFTGGVNFHSKSEWISTRAMGLSLCTVLNLLFLCAD